MAFRGQASLADVSTLEFALLDSIDDPSVARERFAEPGSGGQGAPRVSWDTRVARGALITVLLLAAMLPVALALAIAIP